MKNFNHSKLAIIYLIILVLITMAIIAIAVPTNLFNNESGSLILIVTFVMIFFDACFFFFYFCFKKNKYPYINYQWQEPEIKRVFKKPIVWYFIIPSLVNYLLMIILIILVYAYPTRILYLYQIFILLAVATLLNLINISYVFLAIKFNKNHVLEQDIDFTLKTRK